MRALRRESAVRSLRRRAAVQRRRIEEHVHGDCGRGTVREPCAWVAYERGILVGLWRALEALGEPRSARYDP